MIAKLKGKEYTSEQIFEISGHLQHIEAMLDLISYAGDSPHELPNSSISLVADDAKVRLGKVLEILQP